MPTCFVIMPMTTPPEVRETYRDNDHYTHVLEYLFIPALEGLRYEVIPPSAAGSDVIQGEIIRNLDRADLVLCDMSSLNANVFFELGIRTALDKPVATVRDMHTDVIPFDHSIVNCHVYDGRLEPWALGPQVEALRAHVQACVARGGTSNTLWMYFGVEASARVGSAGTDGEAKLDYVVRQMEDLRSDVSRLRSPHQPDGDRPAGSAPVLHIEPDVDGHVTSLLQAAWAIGMTISASFSAYEGDEPELILDFGGFIVGNPEIDPIKRLFNGQGVSVGFLGALVDDDVDPGLLVPDTDRDRGRRIAWPVAGG